MLGKREFRTDKDHTLIQTMAAGNAGSGEGVWISVAGHPMAPAGVFVNVNLTVAEAQTLAENIQHAAKISVGE